jgi:hypothetical protein
MPFMSALTLSRRSVALPQREAKNFKYVWLAFVRLILSRKKQMATACRTHGCPLQVHNSYQGFDQDLEGAAPSAPPTLSGLSISAVAIPATKELMLSYGLRQHR